MTDLPIRDDVPVSFHPKILSAFSADLDVPGTIGSDGYHLALQSLATAYTNLGHIAEAEAELAEARKHNQAMPRGEESWTQKLANANRGRRPSLDGGMEEQFFAAASEAMIATMGVVERDQKRINQLADALEKNVAEKLRHSSWTPTLYGEVRAHVAKMTPEERFTFIRERIRADDLGSVAAILSAPPYLSGLDAENVALFREQAAAHFAPKDHAQAKAMRGLSERVSNALNGLSQRHLGYVNARDANPRVKAGKKLDKLRAVAK